MLKKNSIRLIAHTKLLDGQNKKSCARGQNITNKYYTFTYTHIDKPSDTPKTFICGISAAEHFIKLANIKKEDIPSLFNPLKSDSNSSNGHPTSSSGQKIKPNPTAEQLSNAINMLIIYWNSPINGVLANIQSKLNNSIDSLPLKWWIKSVNTIISYDKSSNSTLTEMINELRKSHPTIKDYNFDLLIEIMRDEYPEEEIRF
ncbi:hypothetical protein OL548_33905 (plasmid) [Lysinibacillus sp. MHQ-1]|nr:hypothetical protein OL548_33905 [Lysinibacillus sp. MHQ-1]